jgi:hypothetical protein
MMETDRGQGAEVPSREDLDEDVPFTPVAAAFIAAGIGIFTLGILVMLAEASESIAGWLQFSDPVGPLSGKTIIAGATWLVSWPILHMALRGRELEPRRVFMFVGVLIVLGLLMTFPTFFEQFAPEE